MMLIHLAVEFGRFGITVNAYCPGGIYTPLCEHYHLNVLPVLATQYPGPAISQFWVDTIDKDFSRVMNSHIPDGTLKIDSEGFYEQQVGSLFQFVNGTEPIHFPQ